MAVTSARSKGRIVSSRVGARVAPRCSTQRPSHGCSSHNNNQRPFWLFFCGGKHSSSFICFQAARSNCSNKTIPLARINERKSSQLMENLLTDVCGDKRRPFWSVTAFGIFPRFQTLWSVLLADVFGGKSSSYATRAGAFWGWRVAFQPCHLVGTLSLFAGQFGWNVSSFPLFF